MKNFSESNKKLISELTSDIELLKLNDEKICTPLILCEDIEKEIDDIIEMLIESSNIGRRRGNKRGYGRGRSSGDGYGDGGRGSSGYGDGSRRGRASRTSSGYSGDMVTIRNGKKYLGDPNLGLSPSGFWEELRNDLERYVNNEYPEIELRTANLGVTRDLAAASNPSSSARVSGSKHGAGLATDVYLHIKDHPYTEFQADNERLVQDKKLVRIMRSFAATQQGIVWGGNFGGGTGDNVASRGVTEFHHFEIEDSRMPSYFADFADEIEELDGNLTASSITSTQDLARLYSKIS